MLERMPGWRKTVILFAVAKLTVNDIQSLSLAILSLESMAGKLGGTQGKRLNEARSIILEVLTTENTPADEPGGGTSTPAAAGKTNLDS